MHSLSHFRSKPLSWRFALWAAVLTWSAAVGAKPPEAVSRSNLDAQGFYQLLIAEAERLGGRGAVSFELMLDAAKRLKNAELFERAVQLALEGRSGDRALAAVKAWRDQWPKAQEPLRTQLQILVALRRWNDLGEPLQALLSRSDLDEQKALLRSLPAFLQQATDTQAVAQAVEGAVKRPLANPATRGIAQVTLGWLWLQAKDSARAWSLAQSAHQDQPTAPEPALLALALMDTVAEAEQLLKEQLRRAGGDNPAALAYARQLINAHQLGDATRFLESWTRKEGTPAVAWLMLGAARLELRETAAGEQALRRFLALEGAQATAPLQEVSAEEASTGSAPAANRRQTSLNQAHLLLAQVAESRQDWAAVENHLAEVQDPQRKLEIQTRRAAVQLAQGRLEEGLAHIRAAPEDSLEEARAKRLAEMRLLRQAKAYDRAFEVLTELRADSPEDVELMYEQAMLAERLGRIEVMEQLLREVMRREPDHAHAHNALGYALADRKLKLQEARQLIEVALARNPGDPFITDSLGWLEYREGKLQQAAVTLRKAYQARPDAEIGAHLGEVLWQLDQQQEARQVWREARQRDADNEVLNETLQRLKVDL